MCCVTRARADLTTESTFERVERDGTEGKSVVELKGKYKIRNDGANDVNLAGQALMLRFPGYVRVKNDDDPAQSTLTRALPRDWIFECFWSYVEGRYNGTNVCPSIDFVVSSNVVEVRFVGEADHVGARWHLARVAVVGVVDIANEAAQKSPRPLLRRRP